MADFISRRTNLRTDEFGGDIYGRMFMHLEILKKVRAIVGPDYPLFARISAEEFVLGGNTIVHSHPNLPSAHHSHSAADYGAIAWCNAAMLAVKAEAALQPTVPTMPIATIATAVVVRQVCAGATHYAGRAPPCV